MSKNNSQVILYKMEHATGIEPARLAWEAKVLPLNYACIYFVKKPFIRANSLIWWVLTGSNRRPSVRQTDALPAELNTLLVPTTGIEPATY